MAIIETKTVTRPNTSIPFFVDTENAGLLQVKTAIGYSFAENTPSYSKAVAAGGNIVSERTISANGLTQTNVVTFATIADYNRVESAVSIALDDEYQQYVNDNEFSHTENQYVQTGFDSAFSCTTTYTYTANTATLYPLFEYFVNAIEASDKLTSLVNTGTQVIAVHEYANSEDFTANHWQDFTFVNSLHTGEVTRTIAYTLL